MTPAAGVSPAGGRDVLHVMLVGSDPALVDECRATLAAIPDRRVVLYVAGTFAEAIDIARDRQPDFAIVEIERQTDALFEFLKELQLVLPDVIVAGAFQPQRLGQGDSESAVLIGLLRAHVRDFLRRPLSPTELRDVLDRLFSESLRTVGSIIGRVAAFIGNKGGVGKSTLAVNVACALAARHPGQVLLVDASLQLGVCSMLLDMKPAATVLDAARQRDRLDETLLRSLTQIHASGLRLLAAPANAIEAAELGDEDIARVLNLSRRTFEFVVVDTFPMLDSVAMTVLDLSDVTFIVFQGTAPSVAGAMRFLPILEGLGLPPARQRLVLSRNHKGFLGNLTKADIEQRLGRQMDYVVPYDKRVLVSMNTGKPYALEARWWSGFKGAVVGMMEAVETTPAATRGRRAESPGASPTAPRDRRTGSDRRLLDIGRTEGERRSGRDRRVESRERRGEIAEAAFEPELIR